jgi:hypothetical protein
MNHLVFLAAQAGELEKILSGVKSLVLKEIDPEQPEAKPVQPGDSLYFLRNNDECTVRVEATVVRVWPCEDGQDEGLSHILKELQTKLQLNEDQYNYWSARKQATFIEFEAAHKIPELNIAPGRITDRTRWIAFEQIHEVAQEGVKDAPRNDSTD